MEISQRLKRLPPYLFAEIDRAKRSLKEKGVDLIDLGIGDPDQPTPGHIIDELCKAAYDPVNHRYALDMGLRGLRIAISKWYKKRFNVELDPDTEIQPLIGSKEGIAHMPLALINRHDIVLVPEPCYPPYKTGTILADGDIAVMPLLKDNAFLPDFKKIDRSVLKKSKLIFLNYPNNPTGAIAEKSFFEEAVRFAKENNLIVCHDAAYSEISFGNYRAPSFLQIERARDVGIEFHSLSKTYNMTGWRIGWACGNKEIIAALGRVKSNIDSGIFQAVQIAGIKALEADQSSIREMNLIYEARRDCLIDGLNNLGWPIQKNKATFYVWASLPKGYKSSIELATLILDKSAVVTTPGVGFGNWGEGYIRFALTTSEERIKEAVERIKRALS